MKNDSKISLVTAILININVILGAGLFINPRPLTDTAGSLGFLGYVLAAIVLLPIVLSIAELAKSNQIAGGMYSYSKIYLNPFSGFISGWSYFLGKTTSAALLSNVFMAFFQKRIVFLQQIPLLVLDCCLIAFLIIINILGVRIGGKIQYFFISMKAIPVTFVIFTSIFIFNPDFFTLKADEFSTLFSALPIAIFVLTSFEMICSIGHLVENPEKNIRKAILLSFVIVTTIATIFQFLLFGGLGNVLATTTEPVLSLGTQIFAKTSVWPKILNAFVFVSIISGAFGSLTANCWNLYALANDNHLPGKNLLTKVNKNEVPYFSLIVEGLLACLILIISKVQVPLQNMTVFGMGTAYLFSSLSIFVASRTGKIKMGIYSIIPTLAILSCSYIIFLCLRNLYRYGISVPVLTIFIAGLAFAYWKKISQPVIE